MLDERFGHHIHDAQKTFRNDVVTVVSGGLVDVDPHPYQRYAIRSIKQQLAHILDPKSGI